MDARIKSGHDGCGSLGEVEDRFTHTNFNFQTAAPSLRARHRHSGMVRRTRPGISRFRVRCFASPRN